MSLCAISDEFPKQSIDSLLRYHHTFLSFCPEVVLRHGLAMMESTITCTDCLQFPFTSKLRSNLEGGAVPRHSFSIDPPLLEFEKTAHSRLSSDFVIAQRRQQWRWPLMFVGRWIIVYGSSSLRMILLMASARKGTEL